jgi:hypothetical protein
MQKFARPLVMAGLLASSGACGEKQPATPPTPAPASTDAGAAAAPTAPTPAPVATPPAADTAAAVPAEPPATAGGAWLVWVANEDGGETAWLHADGTVAATRAEPAAVIGGTLWAVHETWAAFREVECPPIDADTDMDKPPKDAKPGPKKFVGGLALKALAGADAGREVDVLKPALRNLGGERPADGSEWLAMGEHWGRSISIVGITPAGLWVTDCDSGFGCGVHGNHDCHFATFSPQSDKPIFQPNDLTAEVAALRKGIGTEMFTGVEEFFEESGGADCTSCKVEEVALRVEQGAVKVDYRFVADAPYVANDGSWSSYSRSTVRKGDAVAKLGLGDVPPAVVAHVAKRGPSALFGFTEVPADKAEAFLAAFSDKGTLGARKPEDEAPTGEGAMARVNDGRRLTKDKDYAKAIEAFDAAIALEAGLAKAWSGRGYAKLLAGDLDAAKADLEHALTLDDGKKLHAAVWFNLADIAERKGDKPGAIAAVKKSIEFNRTDAAVKKLEALEKP